MAESFRNFCAGMAITSRNELIVVPSGINGNNSVSRSYPEGYSGSDVREVNTYAQLHSIYLSLKCNSRIPGVDRYNPKNFGAFDLYIRSTANSNYKYYIVHDGRLTPGAPFFIEKNITLEPSQYLVLYCPGDAFDYDIDTKTSTQLNTNGNHFIEVTASGVLFPGAN